MSRTQVLSDTKGSLKVVRKEKTMNPVRTRNFKNRQKYEKIFGQIVQADHRLGVRMISETTNTDKHTMWKILWKEDNASSYSALSANSFWLKLDYSAETSSIFS